MTDKQIAKERMYKAILRNLIANILKYKYIPVFVATVDELTDICVQMTNEFANQNEIANQEKSTLPL